MAYLVFYFLFFAIFYQPLTISSLYASWSNHIVISEFSEGDYSTKNGFIELYNPTSRTVDISEWRVQTKAVGVEKNWRTIVKIPTGTEIQPFSFYLITNTKYVGPEPDLSRYFPWGLLSQEGSIRITDYEGEEIDKVGYGVNSSDYEGEGPVITDEGESFQRLGFGTDTDNNKLDFIWNEKRSPQSSKSIPEVPKHVLKEKTVWTAKEKQPVDDENRSDIIDIHKLYGEAKTDYRKGYIFNCLEKLNKILLIDSQHPGAKKDIAEIPEKIKSDLIQKNLAGRDQFYGEAVLYYIQGDYSSAEVNLKKILILTPDDVEVCQWYEKISGFVIAEPEIEEPVISSAPQSRIEKIKEAPKPKPSVKKEPPAPAISKPKKDLREKAEEHYNNGLKEYSSGYISRAIEEWEICLKYNPNHERAKKALTKAKKTLKK